MTEEMQGEIFDENAKKLQIVTVRMPVGLVDQIDRIAQDEHRSRASVVVEACDLYVAARSEDAGIIAAKERYAQESVDYEQLLNRLKKDLGLDDRDR